MTALRLTLAAIIASAAAEGTCECLTSLDAYGINTTSGLSVTTTRLAFWPAAHIRPSHRIRLLLFFFWTIHLCREF